MHIDVRLHIERMQLLDSIPDDELEVGSDLTGAKADAWESDDPIVKESWEELAVECAKENENLIRHRDALAEDANQAHAKLAAMTTERDRSLTETNELRRRLNDQASAIGRYQEECRDQGRRIVALATKLNDLEAQNGRLTAQRDEAVKALAPWQEKVRVIAEQRNRLGAQAEARPDPLAGVRRLLEGATTTIHGYQAVVTFKDVSKTLAFLNWLHPHNQAIMAEAASPPASLKLTQQDEDDYAGDEVILPMARVSSDDF